MSDDSSDSQDDVCASSEATMSPSNSRPVLYRRSSSMGMHPLTDLPSIPAYALPHTDTLNRISSGARSRSNTLSTLITDSGDDVNPNYLEGLPEKIPPSPSSIIIKPGDPVFTRFSISLEERFAVGALCHWAIARTGRFHWIQEQKKRLEKTVEDADFEEVRYHTTGFLRFQWRTKSELERERQRIIKGKQKENNAKKEHAQRQKMLKTKPKRMAITDSMETGPIEDIIEVFWVDWQSQICENIAAALRLPSNTWTSRGMTSSENLLLAVNPLVDVISLEHREEVVWDLFNVLALSNATTYDARTRAILRSFVITLGVNPRKLCMYEDYLVIEMRKLDNCVPDGDKRVITKSSGRWWKIGLAALIGGAIIALATGLAAPAIGAALGATGLFSASIVAGGSNALIVGGIAGTYGATSFAWKMNKRTAGISEFELRHAFGTGLATYLFLPGITTETSDIDGIWPDVISKAELFTGQHYTLRFETKFLARLGDRLAGWAAGSAIQTGVQQVLAYTLFGGLLAAIAWPAQLLNIGGVIDNYMSMCMNKAEKAGRLLAHLLAARMHGNGPVNLIGYSLGARAIFYCLEELARLEVYGVVDSVVMLGTPVDAKIERWCKARTVVSGRLVNGYNRKDWFLAFAYRAAALNTKVAGLIPITAAPPGESSHITKKTSPLLAVSTSKTNSIPSTPIEDRSSTDVLNSQMIDDISQEEKMGEGEYTLEPCVEEVIDDVSFETHNEQMFGVSEEKLLEKELTLDIENIDLSDVVDGHMDYELTLAKVIALIGIETQPSKEDSTPDIVWDSVLDYDSSTAKTVPVDPFQSKALPDPFSTTLVCVANDEVGTYWTPDQVLGVDRSLQPDETGIIMAADLSRQTP